MVKEIRIKINPQTCEIEYEISGVSGDGCTELTDQLVGGDQVVEQKHSDEYYIPLPQPEYVEDGGDKDN
jgi:hypothetical protein